MTNNDVQAVSFANELSSNGLEEAFLRSSADSICSHGSDFGDLYLQDAVYESWQVENGLVKDASFSIEQGVGVRAVQGESTGFAYLDGFEPDPVLSAIKTATEVNRYKSAEAHSIHVPTDSIGRLQSAHFMSDQPNLGIETARIPTHLLSVESQLKARELRLIQTNLSLVMAYEKVCVVPSGADMAMDFRPMVRINASAVIEHNGRRESAYVGLGGRYSVERLLTPEVTHNLLEDLLKRLEVKLETQPAPAGTMPVVLGNGWGGVLLHEAVGHGLEADFNRRGSSVYSGRVGEQVAAKGVTVVDQGDLPDRRGSLNIDDEGIPTQETTLIEDGVLVGYMQDRQNAALMGLPVTGNGRRESYAHLPMPRMTNTFMKNGHHSKDEVVSSLQKGLYVVELGGGQVDITSGRFVFETSEAWWVENGKLQYPVKGATLVGSGPEAMQKISMIADDSDLDPGIGNCGKAGQSVPVGVGQPTIRVEDLTVGGTG